jgi:hypothetical protein
VAFVTFFNEHRPDLLLKEIQTVIRRRRRDTANKRHRAQRKPPERKLKW